MKDTSLGKRHEARKRNGKETPEDLPTFNRPFEPVTVDVSKTSSFWEEEQAEYRKKGPRWTSPLYQAKARKEAKEGRRDPEFNHKSTLVLGERGYSGSAIAGILGISLRSIRYHQAEPCPSLEKERKEIAWRQAVEDHGRTKRGKAPFLPEAYLVRNGIVTDEALISWFDAGPFKELRSKEKIRKYLADGQSQRRIAKWLGVTQQAVSKAAGLIRRNKRKIVQD